MESEYENPPLEENSDLPASYGNDNPDDGEMDMESFPSDQHLTDLEECGEIPYDAQSSFQELVETEPSITSSSSSSSSVIAVPRTPEPRVPDPTLLNAAVAPIVSDGAPRENPREQHRQMPLSPVVMDVVPNPPPNPQYNMEQVTTALKQTMTGGLNLSRQSPNHCQSHSQYQHSHYDISPLSTPNSTKNFNLADDDLINRQCEFCYKGFQDAYLL